MPQFVAAAGYALSAAAATGTAAYAIGVALVEYQILIGGVGALLGSSALSQSQARKAQRKMREAYNASQVDRMQNVVSTIGQRELVMGRVRKAGTVFAKASTGANKEKFCLAIALAGHEIDAVETVYFNDQPVTLDGSGNVTTEPYMLTRKGTAIEPFATGPTVTLGHTPVGTVSATYTTGTGQDAVTTQLQVSVVGTTATITTDGSTPYTGDGSLTYQYEDQVSKAQVRIYLGTADQTADADLQALFPGDWTADHRARGVAYLICEFDYDETAFPSGIPSVSAVIRGAKLYDPRDASTAWSENPALMVRHLLTHASFGKRTSLTAAEDAGIAAAANACDTSTGYVVSGVTDTRALFTAGTVVPYGAPAADVLDDLCQAMGGMWAYAGGQFYLRAGVYTAPVMTLTEADLAVVRRDSSGAEEQQPIVIGAHKARADKVNVITPRIWDAAQGYKQVALTPLAPAALIARDGAWLAHEIDMPAVNYSPQALHVAGIIIRDDRDCLRVTLPFKLRAYPVELFDTIALTIARYGWSAKEFIVLGRTWTHDGSIQLTLKETAAAIYQLDAAFDPQGYAENTNLPTPWDIQPPSGIAVTSGTADLLRQADGTIVPRVKVAWTAITDKSLLYGGQVEVRYRLATETGWHTVSVPAEETYVYLLGAKEGDVGYCQVRCRNSIAVSDWSLQITHQVAGKSEAPGAITGFTATAVIGGIRLTGTLPTDVDIGTVELWINTVNSAPISGTATFQTSGLADSFVFPIANSAGVRYFWARVIDTSGNAGPFTAAVSATALQSGDADISALSAPKITGQLASSQIADLAITAAKIAAGAVETAKFASTIEPVTLVSSVPGVKYTNAVFNTTDSKLYRWNGSAYGASVASTDISGTLTNAQIADVAAAKLTGQITSTQITDSAVTTAKINAGAVSTAKIAAGAVTADEIASNAVTAAKILAGSVTTAKLAAGAVTANELAANAVTAGKVSAGAISTTELAAGAVTTAKLAAGAVTANEISVTSLSAITANLGTVTAGAISGTSTISISGTANFDGQTYSADVGPAGDYSAVLGNNSKAQKYGVTGFGGTSGAGVFGIGWLGHGVMGSATGSGKHGVYGIAKAGSSAETGVYGWSGLPTKAGVHAENSSGTGVALKITGQMLWGSSQWASPSGTGLLAANGTWVAQSTFLAAGGTAADSSALGGVAASGWTRVIVGNTGTANASGNGYTMQMGTGLAPTYEVNCSGNNIILQTASDRTLKQDIEDEALGLPFVKALRPRRFRFISDPEFQQHGFIAQEVAEVATPNGELDALAFTNPNGKMGINHLSLIGPLVKAVQELESRLAALEASGS